MRESVHLRGCHHVVGGRVLERQGRDARAHDGRAHARDRARVPVAEGVPAQPVRVRVADAAGPLRQRGVVRFDGGAQAVFDQQGGPAASARGVLHAQAHLGGGRELHAVFGPGSGEAAVQPEPLPQLRARDEELRPAHDGDVHARRGGGVPRDHAQAGPARAHLRALRELLRAAQPPQGGHKPRLLQPAEHVPDVPRAGADPQAEPADVPAGAGCDGGRRGVRVARAALVRAARGYFLPAAGADRRHEARGAGDHRRGDLRRCVPARGAAHETETAQAHDPRRAHLAGARENAGRRAAGDGARAGRARRHVRGGGVAGVQAGHERSVRGRTEGRAAERRRGRRRGRGSALAPRPGARRHVGHREGRRGVARAPCARRRDAGRPVRVPVARVPRGRRGRARVHARAGRRPPRQEPVEPDANGGVPRARRRRGDSERAARRVCGGGAARENFRRVRPVVGAHQIRGLVSARPTHQPGVRARRRRRAQATHRRASAGHQAAPARAVRAHVHGGGELPSFAGDALVRVPRGGGVRHRALRVEPLHRARGARRGLAAP
mmetsp:Transcript_1531/g.6405  ORF Transcript_1531/g.6405 Transcript_1531/m.6405 type:complete len:553 (+) Transcript_1531:1559-3217(+)